MKERGRRPIQKTSIRKTADCFCRNPQGEIIHSIVTTRNNIRASIVIALYSMSAIRELNSKSGNTFI
jgi:hypothetical protein